MFGAKIANLLKNPFTVQKKMNINVYCQNLKVFTIITIKIGFVLMEKRVK